MPITAAATFCATLVDEWIAQGVVHTVVAPGSRSTPLALALGARKELSLHMFHDERSAAFCALGIGLATGMPAVSLCTSGTAAAHFHAAVIEADLSSVPMLVCTADRPPEARDVGSAQTIDQTRLYGPSVRWFHDPGVPSDDVAGTWRSLAERSISAARGHSDRGGPGPVHLNLPFREPLVGDPGELPAGSGRRRSWRPPARLDSGDVGLLAAAIDRQRGVIVAGAGIADVAAIAALAAATAWPVLADPRSRCGALPQAVVAFDAILRSEAFARAHAPEIVLRLGEPPASKVLAQWVTASGATQVQVGRGRWFDADGSVTHRVAADPSTVASALAPLLRGSTGTPWLARWQRAERRAQDVFTNELESPGPDTFGRPGAGVIGLTDPSIARTVSRSIPSGGHLVVSSSMPVRDLEWFGIGRGDIQVHSNRGANGIDGVTATGIGVALASQAPVTVLIGDVAFLHDASSLTGLAGRGVDIRIVVVDNDGGAIFSFLPQAAAVTPDRFELLYGTPHGTDLVALARAHGMAADQATAQDLSSQLAEVGPWVLVATTDRSATVDVHARLNDSVIRQIG